MPGELVEERKENQMEKDVPSVPTVEGGGGEGSGTKAIQPLQNEDKENNIHENDGNNGLPKEKPSQPNPPVKEEGGKIASDNVPQNSNVHTGDDDEDGEKNSESGNNSVNQTGSPPQPNPPVKEEGGKIASDNVPQNSNVHTGDDDEDGDGKKNPESGNNSVNQTGSPPQPNPPVKEEGGKIASDNVPQNSNVHTGDDDEDGDGKKNPESGNNSVNQTGSPPQPNPPVTGTGGNQQNNLRPVDERINREMALTAAQAGGTRSRKRARSSKTASFHTMKELLQMEKEQKEEEKKAKKDKKGGDKKDKKPDINTRKGLKNGLLDMRNSNIYKAVVLARELEGGGNNPMRSGRFQRFFKSSKYNKAADSLKIIGAANGALSTLDAVVGEGTYKDSLIGKGIGLISDFMALVTSIRDFVTKIQNYKKGKTKTDNAFSVIGMLTDIFTVLAKGCSMAKTIAGFAGKKDGIFANGALWDRITLLINSASQIGGFLGAARGLHVTRAGISKLKVLENMRWKGGNAGEGIQAIVEKHEQARREGQAPQAGAGKKPQKATKTERAERRAAANKLLNKEEVSSEEKDRLASYVAIHRRIDRTKRSLATTSTGLIAVAIGLGSSIATSVNNNTDSDSSKTAKTWMGFAASLGGIGAAGTKMGIEKRNQEKQDSDEADAVQGRLWGTIEELKDDKYGLKGAGKKTDAAREDAELEEPRAVYKRYVAAQSQFEDSGVNYAQLFQAPDLRNFKKTLISGI